MVSNTPIRNRLLCSLPQAELEQLRPSLEPVTFVLQQVLHEAGNLIDAVYFPESGLASLTADTQDNGLVEVGMTGRDGFVGLSVLLNPVATSIHRVVVQVPGTALRMRSAEFRDAAARLPALRDRCLRHVQHMMVQSSQCAACNARHELPARLARWLLMGSDRIDSDEMPMTQEFLSYMLGVRRAGVSVVMSTLQSAGLIRQGRGRVTILNRAGLEAEACSCYRLIEDSRMQIMGMLEPARAAA